MSAKDKKLLKDGLSSICDIAMISGVVTGNEIAEALKETLASVEAANQMILEKAPSEIAIKMIYGDTKGSA